jgi:putative ABC transport system substrate-binding protein
LRELLGRAPRRLVWLGNPGNTGNQADWADAQGAAASFGAEISRVEASRADEVDKAFEVLPDDLDALLVQWDFLFSSLPARIAELAVRKRLPAVYGNRTHVLFGGLMSYGGDLRENYRQGARYVDRVLRGTPPADLPVVQASRFELALNVGAAKAIGLTIPHPLLARADEVVE